ncbi:UNVERIFIED_CONTAM: PBP1b-binding outer membrane lipoprotein LpoB [Brevibacillus sp. OAP136]
MHKKRNSYFIQLITGIAILMSGCSASEPINAAKQAATDTAYTKPLQNQIKLDAEVERLDKKRLKLG